MQAASSRYGSRRRDILTQAVDALPRNASAAQRSKILAATTVITYQFDPAQGLIVYLVKPALPLKITSQGTCLGRTAGQILHSIRQFYMRTSNSGHSGTLRRRRATGQVEVCRTLFDLDLMAPRTSSALLTRRISWAFPSC